MANFALFLAGIVVAVPSWVSALSLTSARLLLTSRGRPQVHFQRRSHPATHYHISQAGNVMINRGSWHTRRKCPWCAGKGPATKSKQRQRKTLLPYKYGKSTMPERTKNKRKTPSKSIPAKKSEKNNQSEPGPFNDGWVRTSLLRP